MPSATRHPSHRHSGLHPTVIMAPPKRTPTTPLGWPNRQRHPTVPEWCRDSNARQTNLEIDRSWCYVSCDASKLSKVSKLPKNRAQSKCLLNETATDASKRGGNACHGWSPATSRNGNNMSGDNCGHNVDRLSQNGEKQHLNSDNDSLYLHGLKNVV